MKVFLSYTHNDSFLAKKITAGLTENGLDVWNAETEIMPGGNWAEQISDALKESDAMVVLITPESLESRVVSREIEYALGNKAYKNRLIPVVVGSEESLPSKSLPWILQKLQMIRLSNPEETDEGINQIAEVLEKAA